MKKKKEMDLKNRVMVHFRTKGVSYGKTAYILQREFVSWLPGGFCPIAGENSPYAAGYDGKLNQHAQGELVVKPISPWASMMTESSDV